ncbi:MAG TPA: hypothetical protein ENN72_07880 [Firmicutes bacterium]|nr:hypothetical protein [Bacillota bacterium]
MAGKRMGAPLQAPLFFEILKPLFISLKLFYLALLMGIPFVTGSVYVQHPLAPYALLLAGLLILLGFLYQKRLPFPAAAAFLFLFVAALLSPEKTLSFEYLAAFFLSFTALLVFDPADEKLLTPFLAFYSLTMACYVAFQYYVVYPSLLAQVTDPAQRAILRGMRFFGTFALPNIYSFFLMAVVLLMFMRLLKEKKSLYWIPFLVNGTMLLLTRSFIAAVLTFLMIVILALKKNKILGWGIAGAGLSLGGLFFLLTRGTESLGQSLFFRYANYVSALRIFRDYPLAGTGLNHFDLYYPLYRLEGANYVHNAHALPFQMMADLGGIGIAVLLLLGLFLWSLRKSPFFPLLMALMLHFVFDLTFYIPSVAALFWAYAGIAQKKREYTRKKGLSLPALASLFLLCAAFIPSFRYYTVNPPHPVRRMEKEARLHRERGALYSHFITMYKLNQFVDAKEKPQIREQYEEYKKIWNQ